MHAGAFLHEDARQDAVDLGLDADPLQRNRLTYGGEGFGHVAVLDRRNIDRRRGRRRGRVRLLGSKHEIGDKNHKDEAGDGEAGSDPMD